MARAGHQLEKPGLDLTTVKRAGSRFLRENVRSYTMILALLAIWIVLALATGGTFLEARNLSNLLRQTSVAGCIAIGMVLIITGGHIDLSVGSLAGLAGAIAAMLQVQWLPALSARLGVGWLQGGSVSTVIAVGAAVLIGVMAGVWQGVWIAYGRVPAFIVTLGGLLVFRGAILGLTKGVNIAPLDPMFQFLGQGYLTRGGGTAIGAIAALSVVISCILSRRVKIKYDFPVRPIWFEAMRVTFYCALIALFISTMQRYRGVPVPVAVLAILTGVFTFIFSETQFGRYVCAIGGNLEAARLSGVNVRRTVLQSCAVIGALCGVSGVILTARLNAATANAGNLLELNAIAACVIGGTSLKGGEGSIPGAILGALVMASIDNGMSMMNVEAFWQQIVKGLILMIAVLADVKSR